MKKKIVIAVVGVLLVLGGLAGVKWMQVQKLKAAAKLSVPPPESVSSAVVREEKWQGSLYTIGSITAVQGVNVTVELAGTVREIAFESGAVVSKGDLLVRLDTSSEEAQLRAIEAQVELARINVERARKLRADNTLSQAELDLTEATLKQNQAGADVISAAIAKKTIRAPFDGRLGIRQVNLGQYLDTDKTIVSLQSVAPVYCDFTLPQQELAKLKTGMRVRLYSDTYAGKLFEGTLTAINPDLDSTTRSVKLQATFDNADGLLRPGMFARVETLLPEERTVLVIPDTAVLSAPYSDSVFVIEPATNGTPGLVVRQQLIRSDGVRGGFISVEAGLKPGERVVRSGLFKLRTGMSVIENNDLVPKSDEASRPSDG